MLAIVDLVLRHRQANAALEQSTNAITNFLGPSPFLSLSDACKFGSIALLEWIWNASCNRATDKNPGWSLTNYLRSDPHYHKWQFAKSLEAAATQGDLRMVEWIFAHFFGCEAPATVADGAERNGYLRVLRCLSAHTSPSRRPDRDAVVTSEVAVSSRTYFSGAAMRKATENGELAEYLNEGLPLKEHARDTAIDHALSIGDFQLAERLLPIGRCLLDYAADSPRVEMIEWVLECGYLRRDKSLAASTLPDLARSGHLELGQQVVLLHSPFLESRKLWKTCWVRALYEAGICGEIAMLRWLSEHPMGREVFDQLSKCKTTSDLVAIAAQRGHTDILDHLYRQGLGFDFYKAMRQATEGGHASVVKWLLSNHHYAADFMSKRIDKCAEYGHLAILKVIHEVNPATAYEGDGAKRRRVSPTDSWWSSARDPMYWAARGGHLEVLQWFQANCELKCEADTMDVAATNGHLEVVKWLHKNRSEGCTKQAMIGAAGGGHLDVVQWLHYTRSEKCRSDAIYRAAEHGHLATVKWLYERCSKPRTGRAIDRAIRSGHLSIARWLHQRVPQYKIGDELEFHKELVTVEGSWDSANALEVLLFLHARDDYKLRLCFLENLRERLSGSYLKNPDLLAQVTRWLTQHYPESSEMA